MRSNKEICGEIDIHVREPGTTECWDDEYSVVLNDAWELDEDQILQVFDEFGQLCAKIQQRRADEKRKARNNEHH
jgi:hypothetical protein